MFEYIFVLLPIPEALEKNMPVLLVTSVLVFAFISALIYATSKMNKAEKALTYAISALSIMLIFYYGLIFGAAHFVSRYFFPMSPFIAIFSVVIIFYFLYKPSFQRILSPIVLLSLIFLACGLQARMYIKGTTHEHFQVVRWIENHVNQNTWVGAVQTGTLGFFHDRTVNLDGKVNPAALAEKRNQRIPNYVVETTFDDQGNKIEYLADWHGIAGWASLPPLDTHFKLIVNDAANNLAILKRIH